MGICTVRKSGQGNPGAQPEEPASRLHVTVRGTPDFRFALSLQHRLGLAADGDPGLWLGVEQVKEEGETQVADKNLWCESLVKYLGHPW